MDDLEALARRWGVDTGYHDVFGTWHTVPATTLQTIIAALSRGRPSPAEAAPAGEMMRAFQGDGRRSWGLAAQLYSVRSSRNWGIGDFRDLGEIIEIVGRAGGAAVGLNPLHALFADCPEQASPYAPSSRLFLNPLYIAIDAIDGFDASQFDAERNAARASELVDYTRVSKLKLAALRRAYDWFSQNASAQQKQDCARFRAERGERLARFSCFEALRTRYGATPWWQWPKPWSDPSASDIESLRCSQPAECGFVEFMQWLADRQLALCKAQAAQAGLSIGLYLDVAVGVDPAGADAWSHQRSMLPELTVGAPPDEFNRAGQNWGLVPFNPHALPENDFAAVRELLSATMQYSGAIRLDHVLGLMRLYLIPQGMTGVDGAYVRFPFEQLLDVIAQESERHRCIVIGEDLGTVPEGFRETAARWGLWTYRVMMFERRHDGAFKAPADYPVEALATFNTHDLPTFRGWMSGHDLATKRSIGLDPGESEDARGRGRDALRQCLSGFAADPDRFAAAASFLAATPSRLVTVAIDDLLDVTEQINVPGTVNECPNWRRKLPVPLENWESESGFSEAIGAFRRAGRAS